MKYFNEINFTLKIQIIILIILVIYSIYYLIKNFQTIESQLKVIIYILITGFIFLIYNTIKESDNYNRLKNNFSIAKGKIIEYFVPNLKGGLPSKGISSSSNRIKYIYEVKLEKFENAYSENIHLKIPNVKPNLEIEYLVIYETNDPKNSFILLNYPINDNNDIKKYQTIFKNIIPEDAFKIKWCYTINTNNQNKN